MSKAIPCHACRFDFSHNGVIEGQRLGEIEALCRQSVQQEQQVYSKEVALEDAQKINGNIVQCIALTLSAAAVTVTIIVTVTTSVTVTCTPACQCDDFCMHAAFALSGMHQAIMLVLSRLARMLN